MAEAMTDDPAARVQATLTALGLEIAVERFATATATAEQAASAAGCDLGQIVKSMLFVAAERPVLLLIAGDRRADTALLAPLLGVPRKRIRLASAAEALLFTGYAVGGVPPLGHPTPLETLVDETFDRFTTLIAAGGSSCALFRIERTLLLRLTQGREAAISAPPPEPRPLERR